MSVDGLVRNPTGAGGFVSGRSGNPNGRPRSASTAQLFMLRYFHEAAELLVELMRTGTKEDAVRLAAIREVLDRGVGKAVQSVALDLSVNKPLESMSEQELREFRTRYAAIATASPKLLDEVIEADEECAPELPLGDGAVAVMPVVMMPAIAGTAANRRALGLFGVSNKRRAIDADPC